MPRPLSSLLQRHVAESCVEGTHHGSHATRAGGFGAVISETLGDYRSCMHRPSAEVSEKSRPCVSKQRPADGVWRIGRGGFPDRVFKTRFTPSESSAGHGLPPQRAPKQCPANGVRRVL